MHTHSIDFEFPFNLGPIKAQISHRPFDDEHLLVVVTPEKLPKICSIIPRAERFKEREFKLKRVLVESWGSQLISWANEPAEATPDTAIPESGTAATGDLAARE